MVATVECQIQNKFSELWLFVQIMTLYLLMVRYCIMWLIVMTLLKYYSRMTLRCTFCAAQNWCWKLWKRQASDHATM